MKKKQGAPVPAARLRAFMRIEKLTAAQVAKESCMPVARLREILADMTSLRIKEAMRIRDACGRLVLRRVVIEEVFES